MKFSIYRYLLAPLFLVAYSQQAAAYLDPGTGSIILQGIVAAVAMAGFTIKTYWYKIKGFFGKEQAASLLDDDNDSGENSGN